MMIARLLRLERIKLRRRSAFQLAVAIFIGFIILTLGIRVYLGRSGRVGPFTLPGAWPEIHSLISQIVTWFALVTVINITAAEYTWRTARQNVIDGLSREQFYLAKLLMVPALSLLFLLLGYGASILIVGVGGGVTGAFMPVLFIKAMLGLALATLGFGSMALFASILTRNVAGAVLLVIGYMGFLENGLQLIMLRIGGAVAKLISYMPATVLNSLGSPMQYDAAARVRAMDSRPPWQGEPLDPPVLLAVAVCYIALFLSAGYLLVRRQDL